MHDPLYHLTTHKVPNTSFPTSFPRFIMRPSLFISLLPLSSAVSILERSDPSSIPSVCASHYTHRCCIGLLPGPFSCAVDFATSSISACAGNPEVSFVCCLGGNPVCLSSDHQNCLCTTNECWYRMMETLAACRRV